MIQRLLRTALLSALLMAAATLWASPIDVKAITQGVGKLEKPDWPAILNVWGDNAFPVVSVVSDFDTHYASVAAAAYGKGRVVALGYPSAGTKTTTNVARLIKNATQWATRGKTGFQVLLGKGEELPAAKLSTVAAIVVEGEKITDNQIADIQDYVRNGGALIVNVLAYQYFWDHPGTTVQSYAPNRLLIPMGMGYVDNNGYAQDANGPAELEAVYAPAQLRKLLELAKNIDGVEKTVVLTTSNLVVDAARCAPADTKFAKDLKAAVTGVGEVLITPEKPLTWKEPMKRLAVIVKANEVRRLPANKIVADPNGDVFPGKVDRNAVTVPRKVEIPVEYQHWASTGLYVPAGKVVRVDIPKELVDKGVVAQIGCHNSPIAITDSWSRHPMLVMQWSLKAEKTAIASPYGGLLYFVVPDGIRLPKQTVEVDGAVLAPRYVRGQTSLQEWQQFIRHYPGPTAEIGSDRITLTIPSDIARKVEDPEKLMQLWDKTMDLYVDLGMRPLPPKGERVVSDQQIAYGYMYAGYPIMTFLDAAEFGTNVEFLTTKGSWGHWHEIGHNQQKPEWTFEGTGEVTNNLFSLYVMEKIANQPVKDWLAKQMPEFEKYLANGAKFEDWKSKPFLALTMYAQIQQRFGWELFQRVFAEYRDTPESELPKTDDEKRDQWLVRLSEAAGRNLGPFFVKWGVPTSETARKKIEGLPIWMPESLAETSR